MRTIKFRAKAVSKNDWVYGNFIHSKRFEGCSNEFRIHEQETGIESDVLEETLGQFTGLHDKNGKEIYEGDIIRFNGVNDYSGKSGVVRVVFWDEDNSGWSVSHLTSEPSRSFALADKSMTPDREIIGNIHDNPELLAN